MSETKTDRTPEEFRAAVAEKVMGWVRVKPGPVNWNTKPPTVVMEPDPSGTWFAADTWRSPECWRPDLSADDDYRVLPIINEEWSPPDQEEFLHQLGERWGWVEVGDGFVPNVLAYKPGDFCRTALAVVEEQT